MPVIDQPFTYIKWSNPTEVVKVNTHNTDSKTTHLTEHYPLGADLRGGSQVITWGEHYLALTHEVDLFTSEVGRKDAVYRHRFVVWDKNWNLVHITKDFSLMNGHVEFAVGMCYWNDDVLITFGFQDNASYVLKMSKNLLEEFIADHKV